MKEWWSRIGPTVAVGSALGYLLGLIAISEFARVFGVTPGTLGVSTTDYISMAGLSIFIVAYTAVGTVVIVVLLVDAVSEVRAPVRRTQAKNRRDAVLSALGESAGVIWSALMFLSIWILPIALVGGDDIEAGMILLAGGAVSALGYLLFVWVWAAKDRRAILKLPGGASLLPRTSTPRLSYATFWVSRKPWNALGCVLTILLSTTIASGLSATFYADALIDASEGGAQSGVPRAPIVFGIVLSPAWACVFEGSGTDGSPKIVLRVSDAQDRAVLLRDGKVQILVGGERSYSALPCGS